MPDYQQSTGTADAWKRCFRVIINNPMNAVPEAMFFEEDVVQLAGKTIRSESGYVKGGFDPTAMIFLRDPTTGELTGAYTTQGNLYAELYSLYMQLATARDAQA